MMFGRKTLLVLPVVLASSAVQAATTVRQVDLASLVPHCQSKVGTLFVGTFDCKASGCGQSTQSDNSRMSQLLALANAANGQPNIDMSHLGEGATDALETALKATGCFVIQDRQNVEALKKEAELTGTPFAPRPADWMLTGAITSVAVQVKSSQVAGGFIPVVGAFKNTKTTATMMIDVRVIDTKTTEVVQSQSFNATSEKSNWGLAGGGISNGALFGSTSTTNSPELDSVANETVISAANFLTTSLAGASVTTPTAAAASVK
jgi:curli biogenesis system outer membrane secretion channel CsgG